MPCGKEGVQSNSLVSALKREVRCSRVRLLHLLPLWGYGPLLSTEVPVPAPTETAVQVESRYSVTVLREVP